MAVAMMAQSPEVTVVPNLNNYDGNAPFVYNQADGIVYAYNNLGVYEQYGLYAVVSNLKIAGGGDTDIQYIETTTDMDPVPYINTGYVHKSNTRIVADLSITQNEKRNWEALFGARENNWEHHAFVVFCRSDKEGAWNKGCYSRTFVEDGRWEQPGTEEIPQNERITVDALGNKVTFTRQGESVPAATIICDTDKDADEGVNSLYIFDLNTAGANDNRRDNSTSFIKLYGFKIYEGSELVMDLHPIVDGSGQGGLRDAVSGQKFFSAIDNTKFALSPDGEEIAKDAGVTVYEGKLVLNSTDNKIYKYTNGTFEAVGTCTTDPIEIADGYADYRNLNNWRTTEDHVDVFADKIAYDEAAGTNYIEHYSGTGGYEPLWVTVPTIAGQKYIFSFQFSCSEWNSWNANERMKAIVFSTSDFGVTNNGYGDQVLGQYQLPTAETNNLPVSIEFEATTDESTLVYQFGYVDDGRDFQFGFDNVLVQHVDYSATYPELNHYKPRLALLISQIEADEFTPATAALKSQLDEAIAAAKAVVDGDDMEAQKAALEQLQAAYDKAKAIDQNVVDILNKTIAVAKAEGVNTAVAEEFLVSGLTPDELNNALRDLRNLRKNFHAERQENVFPGHDVQAGQFYLYNVGQKRFFTGGSDWGTHAALGMPGTLITLEESEVETDFHINTGLRNGGPDDNPSQYLSYRGYCDQYKAGAWRFVKLSNGNYNILQADYPDVYVKYDPFASTDGPNGDWTTVSTEARNLQEDDLDAQWVLVSVADRDALLESASNNNPVDASYYIVNPGFCQRAEVDPAWQIFNGSVWGRNDNHSDFALESYDSNDCSFSTSIEGLKPGYYVLSCQGFYRDGNHGEQARLITEEGLEPAQNAYLFSGMLDVLLPNITSEVGKAPGMGNMTSVGEYPDGIDQACNYFQNGLYIVRLIVEVDASGVLDIGVAKDMKGHDGDWVVVDNFRLTYYGAEYPDLSGIEEIEDNTVKNTGKIYNLQGVEVKSMNKGVIYIVNGKKEMVK